MDVKKWLMRAWKIDEEIRTLEQIREEEYRRCISITAKTDGIRVAGSSDPHKFERLVELDDKLNKRISDLLSVKAEIEEAIAKVEDRRLRMLLELRYVGCKKWEEIAKITNYSYRDTTRAHGRALVAVNAVLECPTKAVI